jgi:hypothetical protein
LTLTIYIAAALAALLLLNLFIVALLVRASREPGEPDHR